MFRTKKPRRGHKLLIIVVVLALLIGGGLYAARSWYDRNLGPVSSSQQVVYFPVASGASLSEIAADLKQAGLIRSSRAFETYVKSRQLYPKMQAGTYALSPSMSTRQIVDKIIKGETSTSYITILPGKTVKQIRSTFKQAGYADSELDSAFDPATYADDPLIKQLPAGVNLEGFLYPETFQREQTTPAAAIVRESIQEMEKRLTPDVINGFAAQGLSLYQGVTLASIVLQESGDPAADPTVAQVFLLRLKRGIMLGSDVTARYGAQHDGINLPDNAVQAINIAIAHDSPYNTRIHSGLPPGPISNTTEAALNAVAHPSSTDYLFFVAGDDGTIHFSHTEAEHEQAVKKYCTKQCS